MRKMETIKKELYDRIRAQVIDRIGLQDREIKKTEKSFNRFFSNTWKQTTSIQLQRQINQSNIIFWGDFHGVRQYQNNLLRWLKNQDLSREPVVVALECLPSQSQKWVDEYLKSRISEEEFLTKVKWDKVWGFPWTHYKPLFNWARENRQVLRVLNDPQNKSTSKQREAWGIKLLSQIVKEFPKSKIFCLYGEYHLLPQGFPSLLKKIQTFKPVYVFQNSDSLYFQKPPKNQSEEGKILKMNSANSIIVMLMTLIFIFIDSA